MLSRQVRQLEDEVGVALLERNRRGARLTEAGRVFLAEASTLERHFPEKATWTRPNGGMFLMATLPNNLNASDLLKLALQRQVAFVPGDDFHVNDTGQNTLRLNFSNAEPALIEEGVKRLGEVLQQMLAMAVNGA